MAPPVQSGPADVVVQCSAATGLAIRPTSVWLPTDTSIQDTVQTTAIRRAPARPNDCTIDWTAFDPTQRRFRVHSAESEADTGFRILLEPSAPGFDTLWVRFNNTKPAPVPLLAASRAFAQTTIAHRSAGWGWPENALVSLRAAAAAGVVASEIDVRLSRDSIPVLMHDSVVDRTTNGVGFVEDLTAAQLLQLDAGVRFGSKFVGERVPSLEQVLAAMTPGPLLIMLDIKPQTIVSIDEEARLLTALVARYNAEAQVILFSDDTLFLRRARQYSPTIGLLFATHRYRPWHRTFSRQLNVWAILYHPTVIVDPAERAGIDIMVADGFRVMSNTNNDLTMADSMIRSTPVRLILTDIVPKAFARLP